MFSHRDPECIWLATQQWAKIGPPLPIGQFTLSGWLASQPKGGRAGKLAGSRRDAWSGQPSPSGAPLLTIKLPSAISTVPDGQDRLLCS